MLRTILKALRSALRSMLKMINGVWTALFGDGGGDIIIDDIDGPHLIEPDKDLENIGTTPITEHDLRTDRRRNAALVQTYAFGALADGTRPKTPPCLPRTIKDWLQGLTASDLEAIAEATPDGVFRHIGEGPYIAGLRRVQKLKAVNLEAIPRHSFEETVPRELSDLSPTNAP